MNIRQIARFPFLKESSEYLRKNGITLEALVKSRAYEPARLLGKERVLEAVDLAWIPDHPITSDADATTELLSYPIARILVSCLADEAFVKRYAIAEAKRAHEALRREVFGGNERKSITDQESESIQGLDFAIGVAKELGLSGEREDGKMAVDFTDYLRFSSMMKSRSWKLVNQRLSHGSVVISVEKFLRLVESSLTARISSELPLQVNNEILTTFASATEEIRIALAEKRAEHPRRGLGTRSYIRFPPCMKRLLDMIRTGENVPHSGRFALVAFLHTLGMDSDDILTTFATSPDFDENKSRYQIQHISGEISGTEYTPPGCSTMKSYGICYDPDSLCRLEWMDHPLKYYRAKGKKFRLG